MEDPQRAVPQGTVLSNLVLQGIHKVTIGSCGPRGPTQTNMGCRMSWEHIESVEFSTGPTSSLTP